MASFKWVVNMRTEQQGQICIRVIEELIQELMAVNKHEDWAREKEIIDYLKLRGISVARVKDGVTWIREEVKVMHKCKHADLIMEYAKDCQEYEEPWKLWQVKAYKDDEWGPLYGHMCCVADYQYRRKPRTVIINGIEVDAGLSEAPLSDSTYYFSDVSYSELWNSDFWIDRQTDRDRLHNGIVHLTAESAVAMAKAMLAFKKI